MLLLPIMYLFLFLLLLLLFVFFFFFAFVFGVEESNVQCLILGAVCVSEPRKPAWALLRACLKGDWVSSDWIVVDALQRV